MEGQKPKGQHEKTQLFETFVKRKKQQNDKDADTVRQHDVSCTFDKDGSELVLMMTDGASSGRENCKCFLELVRHRVIKHKTGSILAFSLGMWWLCIREQ